MVDYNKIKKAIKWQAIETNLDWLIDQLPEKVLRDIAICELKKQNKLNAAQIGIKFNMPTQTVYSICKKCIKT